MYSATVGCPSSTNRDQTSDFLQNQNSFFQVGDQQYCLFYLNDFNNDHVEGLAHFNSRLNGAIFRSTLLNALRPGAFSATNKASRLC